MSSQSDIALSSLASIQPSPSPIPEPGSLLDHHVHDAPSDSLQPKSGEETRLYSNNRDAEPTQSELQPMTAVGPDKRTIHAKISTKLRAGIRYALVPSQHHLRTSTDPNQRTVRWFSKREQRSRLWLLSISEFVLTILICAVYFFLLMSYSHKEAISVPQRRVFNALTTATSLALGVNLAASLRSYAKMMRWRLLSIRYRPLSTFEIIMGCDSMLNTIKLLFLRPPKERLFSPVRVYAVIWILVNLSAAVLVGMIGLTYNLDLSDTLVLTRRGTVLITDLSRVLTDDYQKSLTEISRWGSRGWVYETTQSISASAEFSQAYGSFLNGSSWYYFDDWNKDGTKDVISWRLIEAEAYCTAYQVTEGADGTNGSVRYAVDGIPTNQSIAQLPGPGGLVVTSSTNSTCGDRCTNLLAFQAQNVQSTDLDRPTAPVEARFFACNNTIYQPYDVDSENTDPDYEFPDLQARMIAGAIGWSGNPTQGINQQVTYLSSSDVAFNYTPTSREMASLISRYSIAAVAAGDSYNPGIGRKAVEHGLVPIDAQLLRVRWNYAGALLAGIPFLQFLTLMAVIIWANKAIIKDDSYLAIAKVYHSVLDGLGNHGCMLRGSEIASELGEPMVAYGFVPPDGSGKTGHTDVFLRDSGVLVRRAFEEGEYDGEGALRGRGKTVMAKVKLD